MAQFYPGDFICSCGYLRAGKTMNSVRLALNLHLKGWNIVSNIDVKFATQRLKYIEELYEVRNSVILLDEVQATIDSRDFAKNVTVTQQGIYFGKRGNIVIMTTPHFGMLDIRYRQLTRYLFQCRRVVRHGKGYTVVEPYIHDGMDNLKSTGKFVMKQELYYGLYDTLDENVALISRDLAAKLPQQAANEQRRVAPSRNAQRSFIQS